MRNVLDRQSPGAVQQFLEPPLALDQRQVAQIVAIMLDQVEGMQLRLMALGSAARGSPASRRRGRSPTSPSIRNDDALMRSSGVNDSREAVGPVMTVAREAANARAIPAHHQPVAVVLDLVNPQRAGRWPRRPRRQAWFDEAGGMAQDHGGGWSISRAVQSRPCLPCSYAAIDCFEGSNGKPRTLPAGFLWLPTSRCIAHGWGLLSSLWG